MRIVQAIDALDVGDAVSTCVLAIHKELLRRGIPSLILSTHANQQVDHLRLPVGAYTYLPNDVLIVHFSGATDMLPALLSIVPADRRALIYHNVTPPHYFTEQAVLKAHCERGLQQVRDYVTEFEWTFGVSTFNTTALSEYGAKDARVLPLALSLEDRLGPQVLDKVPRASSWLYVGRLAPNKCVHDVLLTFTYYWMRADQSATLALVGDDRHYESYRERLMTCIAKLPCRCAITVTGKVPDEALRHRYGLSDVLLQMSEHEGFCAPLLEGMWSGLLTVAFAGGAIAETMAGAGILLRHKEHERIAELIRIVVGNPAVLGAIMESQARRARQSSDATVVDQLLASLTTGK